MSLSIPLGSTQRGTRFSLPVDLIATAVLANRGAGKTYMASVVAEGLLEARQHVVAIDTTGAWWGLKSSADGKRPGFPVVVLGGEHADVPLTESVGEIVATAIVTNRFPAVIDLSLFRKGQMLRFLAPFLETLYRLNREPLFLFCDEADEYAPQRPRPESARTLGAMEDIVRRGRRRGIGPTLITQRPAVLNKDVLTQCEMLFAMRMSHPLDIDAIREWIRVHSEQTRAAEVVASLPSLPGGQGWVWSPSQGDILERVKVRARTTFDSSATPKPGQAVRLPKCFAEIDIASLGKEIAKAAELGRANDPAALRAEIAKLKSQLLSQPAPKPVVERIPFLSPDERHLLDGIKLSLANLEKTCAAQSAELATVRRMMESIAKFKLPGAKVARSQLPRPNHSASAPLPVAPAASSAPTANAPRPMLGGYILDHKGPIGNSFSKAERLILTVLAQYGECSKPKTAAIAGYAVTGGGFNNALGHLRALSMVTGSDPISITESGRMVLGSFQPLPTGRALIDDWLRRLHKAERAILEVVAQIYPETITKEDLSIRIGYAADGGGFNNALGRLRTLELITRGQQISASPNLFS